MKYDILVQTEVFYTLKFVCGYFYWLENNICQKKSGSFSPKIGRKKNCQNPFHAILTKKKRKKVTWTTNSLGGGAETLVAGPLKKKHFFYLCLPLALFFIL